MVINLGIGIGLRPEHYEEIFQKMPDIDWFEIISENYMVDAGKPLENLEKILERYPVVQHGVSLAIGSPDPLDFNYLKKLKALARKTKTPWISDHLCWGHLEGAHFHDLLPLPYTKEVIDYVVERAKIVQDYLEIPFALENLSSYVSFQQDCMTEWEFYSAVVEKANIYMMLDVNNIYVSSRNHGFKPKDYYENIPLERVIQIHLAGHSDYGDYVLDTHDNHVCDEVWGIYKEVYNKTKGVSTLLEWDDNFLSFEDTWKEALRAKQFQENHAIRT
ncbi:MAG TPA: DUF692 domain-containing protein [Rhabdochlamydiaceae bacterium]|nr:DUF692 domain-containing protein [Rhabdochlamydiaceae bacterium]